MSYSSLSKYYEDLFILSYHHKYPISEMERMVPYERDLITMMINNYLKEEEEKRRLEERQEIANRNARPRF